jgi:6-phosphogluconolactonase
MESVEQRVYVGSYAAADQSGLQAFDFDPASGAMTPRGGTAGISNPSFFTIHPVTGRIYAVGETHVEQDGIVPTVWAVDVAPEPLRLTPINSQPSGGDFPCHVALDATGRWLVVSNYGSGSVGVFPVEADGALGAMSDFVQHEGHGPNPERQAGPHAHSAIFSPDNRFLIVADLGIDALVVYQFDAATGRLTAHDRAAAQPGAGPRHMAWQPGPPRLFVANELDSTLAVYDYDTAAGRLTPGPVLSTLPGPVPENWVADIHVAPEGERVYVSNRGHDSIAIFGVAAAGGLTREAVPSCGGRWPRNFALAPGGGFLLAANQYSDTVTVLPLPANGTDLGAAVVQVPVPGASCVRFA